MRDWTDQAVRKIEADAHRSADTHLFQLNIPRFPGVHLYLKDESTHPTGSLKHRLARSLFLYALVNGKLHEHSTIIEASSGSTAVSEAYFSRMIGLPFIAVMPRSTAKSKIRKIEFYGGQCHLVESAPQMHDAAVALAGKINGYFMDQFMYAERATDWRGNNNIAESMFRQMEQEKHPVPRVIVMGAGTGGTSATIGRYIRYKGYDTRLIVVDPENSAFYDSFINNDPNYSCDSASRIEGIGRPRVEPSFQPDVIDEMMRVPDTASVAAVLWLEQQIRRKTGPSTGTNLWGCLRVAQQMTRDNEEGSIVTLLCDSGERYLDTYYNREWVREHIGDVQPHLDQIDRCEFD